MKKIKTSLYFPFILFYAEIGGPGLASANFDMRFSQNEDGFGGRIRGSSKDELAQIILTPVSETLRSDIV